MNSMQFIPVRLSLMLITLLFFSWPHCIHAKNDVKNHQTPLSLTLFLVKETEACRPNGYRSDNAGQNSQCAPLTVRGDISAWKSSRVPQTVEKIPPTDISLGNNIGDLLDDYCNAYPDAPSVDPKKRKAIVILFDFGTSKNFTVSLARKNRNGSGNFSNKTWTGTAVHGRWVHHERADAFIPSNKAEWTLIALNKKWVFTTKGRRENGPE